MLALVLVLFPGTSGAEAWVRSGKSAFLALQNTYYTTDRFFDEDGARRQRDGRFHKFETNLYVEYGITSRYTAVANVFLTHLRDHFAGSENTETGIGDIEIGVRRSLWNWERSVTSVQLLAIAPTGYDIDRTPRLGYGRAGTEISLAYGRSFDLRGSSGFLESKLGFRAYFGYPSEQLRARLSLGYDLWRFVGLLSSLELHYGLGNGSNKNVGGNVLLQPNYRLLKLSAGPRFRLAERWSLNVEGIHHLWGEETGAGGGIQVSLWWEL